MNDNRDNEHFKNSVIPTPQRRGQKLYTELYTFELYTETYFILYLTHTYTQSTDKQRAYEYIMFTYEKYRNKQN